MARTRRADGRAGKPADVSCAGGPPLTPCVVPCHPVGTVSDVVGSFPTWHVNKPMALALGRSPAICPRANLQAMMRELRPDSSLIGCTDRGRAGYPSDSSRAGREQHGQYTPTPTSSGAATTRGLRLRLHLISRHLRHRRPRWGRGVAGCVPFTLFRGSRAIPARPAAVIRIGCTRSLVTGLRASSSTTAGPTWLLAVPTRLAAQPRVGIDFPP